MRTDAEVAGRGAPGTLSTPEDRYTRSLQVMSPQPSNCRHVAYAGQGQ